MAQDGCGPHEAFEVLRSMSNRNNVRLADVAAAIVREIQTSGNPSA